MDLYLVRHGEAKSEAEDPRRPLSVRGREEVEKASRAAVKKGMRAARILHSDKLRAKETAEILASAVLPPEGTSEFNGLAPQDDPLLAKAEVWAGEQPLILVGHLPHLERLASLLVSGDQGTHVVDFLTGTIACLSQGKRGWKIKWALNPASV